MKEVCYPMSELEMLMERICHLFLPNRCLFCRKPLGALEKACSLCETYIRRINPEICSLCEKTSCSCEIQNNYFDALVSAFYYEDEVANAILDLKFHDNLHNAKKLSYYLLEVLEKKNMEEEADLLIPVPLYQKDFFKRGYNQSEELAKHLSKRLKKPMNKEVLIKTRATKKQHHLTAKERKYNLKEAFMVTEPQQIREKTILLIDDVFTTGSTMKECSQILKENGAKKIIALTVAKAVSPIAQEDKL